MLHVFGVIFAITGIFSKPTSATTTGLDASEIGEIYLDKLLDTISGPNKSSVSVDKLNNYFTKHAIHSADYTNFTKCMVLNDTTGTIILNEECMLNSCLSPTDVIELSGLANAQNVTTTQLSTLAAILVHLYENSSCMDHSETSTEPHAHRVPSSAEAWGYGFLLVTAINLCSLGGLIVLPFIHHSLYKKILIFMIALAVGTLAGSSLMFLIPEALDLVGEEINAESYVWKSLTIICGIFVFFNIERILKMIMDFKKNRDIINQSQYGKLLRQKSDDPAADISTFHNTPQDPNAEYKDVDRLPKYATPCGDNHVTDSASNSSLSESTTEVTQNRNSEEKKQNGNNGLPNGLVKSQNGLSHSHHHHHQEKKPVATVAWMIIFGDGIHNFIDGVSIGAAFTESILAGVSVSLAIFCEELPHELGDFAVLLNAGMKLKRAVMYNFLSACMCYLGMAVGIVLGENTSAHSWVFAFAGGMFLYISLVDMMPEMNSCAESEENKKQMGEKFIYLLQNLGLLTGFVIMLLMAIYGDKINLE